MQPCAQRRLDRPQVEDQPARDAFRQRLQQTSRRAERRCQHDQVMIERRGLPVGHLLEPRRSRRRVGDLHAKALARQEFGEPSAHLACAAEN